MIRLVLFYTFLAICCRLYGQIQCEKDNFLDLKRRFIKASKKNKSDSYEYANMTFYIAECYRQNNDTNCLTWYRNTVKSGRSSLIFCDRDKIFECNRTMGQIGISQFYIEQYEESIKFLEKVVGNPKNPEYNYYLGLSQMKIGNYDFAIVEFNNFKAISADFKDVDDLIKICQEKTGKK